MIDLLPSKPPTPPFGTTEESTNYKTSDPPRAVLCTFHIRALIPEVTVISLHSRFNVYLIPSPIYYSLLSLSIPPCSKGK